MNIDRLALAIEWVQNEAPTAISGSGGHDATFKVACFLMHGFELSEPEMEEAMRVYNQTKCSPPWSEAQLRHKVDNAYRAASKYPRGWLLRKIARERGLMADVPKRENNGVAPEPRYEPKWKLPFDQRALESYARPDWRVDEDWMMAKSPIDPRKITPVDFLNLVFAPGDRVLIFTKFSSQGQFGHVAGEQTSWRLAPRPGLKPVKSKLPEGGPDGVWFLANPVDGKWHPNPRENGKQSRRSQESVVCQRFLVMETDHKGIDNLWLNFLAQLPLPVVAIYSSGGKSWHALCRLDFPTKQHLDLFKHRHGGLFSKLGADPRAWSPTQLTRLPQCMRGDRKQKLIYLNPRPEPGGVPIGQGGNVICE